MNKFKLIITICLLTLLIGSCSNKCDENSCQNGGKCVANNCQCADGYSGSDCEKADIKYLLTNNSSKTWKRSSILIKGQEKAFSMGDSNLRFTYYNDGTYSKYLIKDMSPPYKGTWTYNTTTKKLEISSEVPVDTFTISTSKFAIYSSDISNNKYVYTWIPQ